jgi:hypothetical protein
MAPDYPAMRESDLVALAAGSARAGGPRGTDHFLLHKVVVEGIVFFKHIADSGQRVELLPCVDWSSPVDQEEWERTSGMRILDLMFFAEYGTAQTLQYVIEKSQSFLTLSQGNFLFAQQFAAAVARRCLLDCIPDAVFSDWQPLLESVSREQSIKNPIFQSRVNDTRKELLEGLLQVLPRFYEMLGRNEEASRVRAWASR